MEFFHTLKKCMQANLTHLSNYSFNIEQITLYVLGFLPGAEDPFKTHTPIETAVSS